MDDHTAATRSYRLDTDLARVRPSLGEKQPPSVGGFVGVLFDKQRTKIQNFKRPAIAPSQHTPKPRDSPIFALPSSLAQRHLHILAYPCKQSPRIATINSLVLPSLSPTPRTLSSEHADRYPSAAPRLSVSCLTDTPQLADGYPSASSPLARSLHGGGTRPRHSLSERLEEPQLSSSILIQDEQPSKAAEPSSTVGEVPLYNSYRRRTEARRQDRSKSE